MWWLIVFILIVVSAFGFWACFLYLEVFAHSTRMHDRVRSSPVENPEAHLGEIMSLLRLDFFGIHCPWSWKRAVRFRVQEVARLLKTHKHKDGWTLEDCANPEKHEAIAKSCFFTRSSFWFTQLILFLLLPAVTLFSRTPAPKSSNLE